MYANIFQAFLHCFAADRAQELLYMLCLLGTEERQTLYANLCAFGAKRAKMVLHCFFLMK